MCSPKLFTPTSKCLHTDISVTFRNSVNPYHDVNLYYGVRPCYDVIVKLYLVLACVMVFAVNPYYGSSPCYGVSYYVMLLAQGMVLARDMELTVNPYYVSSQCYGVSY